jgi:hypothetical protein
VIEPRWLLEDSAQYYDLENFPPGTAHKELERLARRIEQEKGPKSLGGSVSARPAHHRKYEQQYQ